MRAGDSYLCPPRPIDAPCAWTGDALGPRRQWEFVLAQEHLEEIERAEHRMPADKDLAGITRVDFPLPTLGGALAEMGERLRSGCGFVLLTGLDVTRHPETALRRIFVGIGAHFGNSVSQSHRGEYLGDVIDRAEAGNERPYRRGGTIDMHRDPSDIVGLFCYRNAKAGGLSRIASAAAIWNTLLSERPDLLAPLTEGFHFYRPEADRGGSPPLTASKLPVFSADTDGQLHCSFIPELIRAGARHGAGELDPVAAEALDRFAAVANRPGVHLDMEFKPGDMQFLNDRTIVHGRTDYDDWPEADRKRHLFRLWLMCPHWPRPSVPLNVFDQSDRAGGGIPKAPAA